jgi:hypothetical protein
MENNLAFLRPSNYTLQSTTSIETDPDEGPLFLPEAEILQCPWHKNRQIFNGYVYRRELMPVVDIIVGEKMTTQVNY